MALIKCPHCGQPVSDSATQCPHCQKQLMTATQRSWTKKTSMTAMVLCIVGALLTLCTIILNGGFSLVRTSVISFLIFMAWLIWFVKGERQRYTAIKVGIIICLLVVVISVINIIPLYLWRLRWLLALIQIVLSIMLGITFFFLRPQDNINSLTKTVGVLFVECYLIDCVLFFIGYGKMAALLNDILYVCLMVSSAVWFYRTYKQAKSE